METKSSIALKALDRFRSIVAVARLFFTAFVDPPCASDAFNWPLNGCLERDEALALALSEFAGGLSQATRIA